MLLWVRVCSRVGARLFAAVFRLDAKRNNCRVSDALRIHRYIKGLCSRVEHIALRQRGRNGHSSSCQIRRCNGVFARNLQRNLLSLRKQLIVHRILIIQDILNRLGFFRNNRKDNRRRGCYARLVVNRHRAGLVRCCRAVYIALRCIIVRRGNRGIALYRHLPALHQRAVRCVFAPFDGHVVLKAVRIVRVLRAGTTFVRISGRSVVHLVRIQHQIAMVMLALVCVANRLRQIARDDIALRAVRRDHRRHVCTVGFLRRVLRRHAIRVRCVLVIRRVQVDAFHQRPVLANELVDEYLQHRRQAVRAALLVAVLLDRDVVVRQDRLARCAAIARFQGELHLRRQCAFVRDVHRLEVCRYGSVVLIPQAGRAALCYVVVPRFVPVVRQLLVEVLVQHRAQVLKAECGLALFARLHTDIQNAGCKIRVYLFRICEPCHCSSRQ